MADSVGNPPATSKTLRRLAIAAAILVGVVAIGALLAWTARPQLVAFLLENYLRASGAPGASLTVSEVTRDRLRIQGLLLGSGEEAAAETVEVDYRLAGFGFPEIRSIAIEGLQLYVTPGAERPMGALSSLLEGFGGGGESEATALPPIKCFSCRVILQTVAGPINVNLSGQLAPEGSDKFQASGLWTADSRFGNLGGQLAGEFTLAGDAKLAIDVTEGAIVWAEQNVAAEGMTGELSLELAAAVPAAVTGHLRSGKFTRADLPTVAFALDFDYTPHQASFAVSAVDPANSFVAKLHGDVADPAGSPVAELVGELSMDETAPVWALADLPPPATGRASLGAEVSLPLPPLAEIANMSLPEGLTATLSYDLETLRWDGYVSDLSGAGEIQLERRSNVYALTSLGTNAIRGVLDPDQRAKIALPAGLASKIDGRLIVTIADGSTALVTSDDAGLSVTGTGAVRVNNPSDLLISARGSFTADPGPVLASFTVDEGELWVSHWSLDPAATDATAVDSLLVKGTAAGTPDEIRGQAHLFAVGLGVDAGEVFAKRASANLHVDYTLQDRLFTAALAEPGAIAAEGLRIAGLRGETQSLALTASAAKDPLVVADFARPEGLHVVHAVKLQGFRMTASPGVGEGPVTVAAPSADVTGEWSEPAGWQGAIAVYNGRLQAPADEIAAEGIDARIRLGAGLGSGKVTAHIAKLTLAAGNEEVPVLSVDGTATLAGNGVDFDLKAADPAKVIDLSFNGSHDLKSGAGAGHIEIAPIEFQPGGLQPRHLLPELAEIEEATGTVSLAGGVAWRTGAVFSDATLRIEDLSITTPDLDVVRMNGAVALQSLSPFRTRPDQQIAVASLDLGLPMQDGLITFTAAGRVLSIKSAELHMADGNVSVEPVVIDPADPEGQIRLHVDDVDLEQLLALAEITGLSGTGRLSGVIPVTLDGSLISIAGARLDAAKPGRLSYAPDAPPPALQDNDETVSLVMSALSNFQYEKLWMTLDRKTDGDAEIGLHVTGRNPDFYDGYPIEFNLTLAGKLDQILKDSLVGYSVPDLVRQRLEATRPASGTP